MIKEALVAIVVIFGGVAGVVWGLTEMGVNANAAPPPREVNFRQVCTNLHGTTVWNGRNLECLK